MVLAAGFGKRLRPITLSRPKPLVHVAGRTLLDRTLDHLALGGVHEAVVNVHYLGEQIIDQLASSKHRLKTLISDEREEVLETAGGIIKALPHFGDAPLFSVNADTFWVQRAGTQPAIAAMRDMFDANRMDMLLLVCDPEHCIGHSGSVDFFMDDAGRLTRANGASDGFVYAGVVILHPRIFAGAIAEPHSLNRYFDRAISADRLFGMQLTDAFWYTVSTPESLTDVETHLRAHGDMPLLSHNGD